MSALGAMRCLARRERTVFAATGGADLAAQSRFYRPALTGDGSVFGENWTDDDYDTLASMPVERAVLVPCSDVTAAWVARMPETLKSRFVSSNPSARSLNSLEDKREFAQLCRQLDIPHPQNLFIESSDDLARAPIEELTNWFFKPSNSHAFQAKYDIKGVRITTRTEAETLWKKFSGDAISILLQEYVAGGADQHYFIDGFRDREGVVRARLARRRHRIYPRDFGNSSYCEQVPLDDVRPAWNSLERILEHLEYRGIFSAEFKYDAARDEFRILEVNARVWIYVEFAARCGIDVCDLSYLDALEQDVPDLVETSQGAGCVSFYDDFKSVRECPAEDRPSALQLLRQWISARKMVFCWDDPKPFIVWLRRRWLARQR
jgi:D-aspartate ligase